MHLRSHPQLQVVEPPDLIYFRFVIIIHSGHYTAFARDDVCGSWLHLNDKAVTRTTLKALNGPLPYVLFIKLVRSLKIRGGSELISERLSYPVYTGFGL